MELIPQRTLSAQPLFSKRYLFLSLPLQFNLFSRVQLPSELKIFSSQLIVLSVRRVAYRFSACRPDSATALLLKLFYNYMAIPPIVSEIKPPVHWFDISFLIG